MICCEINVNRKDSPNMYITEKTLESSGTVKAKDRLDYHRIRKKNA